MGVLTDTKFFVSSKELTLNLLVSSSRIWQELSIAPALFNGSDKFCLPNSLALLQSLMSEKRRPQPLRVQRYR